MDAKRKRSIIVVCGFALALAAVTFAGETASPQQSSLRTQLLTEFKGSDVFWQQLGVARKIVALHDRSVLPELVGWLSHEDRHERANAAFIFASLGDNRGFEVIRSILTDESDRPEAQGIPAGGLRSSGGDNDAWSKLNHPNRLAAQIKSDRYYAVALLGDLKDPRAVPTLIPLLEDTDVNWGVPFALAQIGDKRAIPPLINVLSDRDSSMRVLAIDALKELHAKEAIPALNRLLSDNEKSHFGDLVRVSEAARDAIWDLEDP
jgi:HEAT repeat protein